MILECETQFFNILGSTQTFIGVLLTLNVLCLFLDKNNNFIFSLLEDQNQRFVKRLIECQSKIQSEIDAFQDSSDYKDFQKILHSLTKLPMAVAFKAQMLGFNVTVNILNYSTDITGSYSPLDKIQKYREQVLAPVFSLGFGLIVFVLDEIGRFIPKDAHLFVLAIYAFLFVAILYWWIIWSVFINHSARSHEEDEIRSNWVHKVDRKLGIWKGAVVKYILCGILYWVLLKFLPWHWMNANGKVIFSIFAMILPISIFGSIRMWACRVKGEYSYMHVLGHLCAMLAYAAMIGGIYQFVLPMDYEAISWLVNTKVLSLLISIFLLINGILLPFLCPYYRCTSIYADKNKEIQKSHDDIKKQIAAFTLEFNEMCRVITRETLKSNEKG